MHGFISLVHRQLYSSPVGQLKVNLLEMLALGSRVLHLSFDPVPNRHEDAFQCNADRRV